MYLNMEMSALSNQGQGRGGYRPGAGRPAGAKNFSPRKDRSERASSRSITLPAEVWDELLEMAKDRGISVPKLCAELIQEKMKEEDYI